jgi:hypothetical protein
MKKNLFLITVKQYNGTELIHVHGSNIADAISRAYDYLDQSKTPGVAYEILEVKFVGKIVEPDYSLTV